ncbi:PEGA domain-containing protein [Candidatus Woesearchaeota archaeon]|nr:PEGA domain-containing protein [Candidatus Woesearchaeota archaeon]
MKNKLGIVLFCFFIAIAAGCAQKEAGQTEEKKEQFGDTGILVVESYPVNGNVYVEGELKGEAPLTLYNFPAGTYIVSVRKEGYVDFEKKARVTAGRTEEISAFLTPRSLQEPKQETKPVEKEIPKNAPPAPLLNKIRLNQFSMYYDFEKGQFTETRTDKSDLLSRKYETYVHFTALTPAKIYPLNKPIKDVTKEDCIFSDDAVAVLYSMQALCVKTIEGSVAAIGGSWQAMPDELEWVLFS